MPSACPPLMYTIWMLVYLCLADLRNSMLMCAGVQSSSSKIAPGQSESVCYWKNLHYCGQFAPRVRANCDQHVSTGRSNERQSVGSCVLEVTWG